MKSNLKSFKNKESSVYIDVVRIDGKYDIHVYDFILLRDVYIKQGLSKKLLDTELKFLMEKYNCFIEV